jgi:peroxiredoxin
LAAFAALALALPARAQDKTEAKPDPDLAKDFTLKDVAGKEHKLKDYKGKIIVLEWVNHGCPFVVKHYKSKNMQALQEKYTKKEIVWLTICSSAEGRQGHMTAEQWKDANKKMGVKSTAVLLDPKGTVGKLYGARTTPQICVIDKKFKRVYDGAIDSIRSTDVADIKKADNYAQQVCDALLAGKPSPVRRTKPYGCSVNYPKNP